MKLKIVIPLIAFTIITSLAAAVNEIPGSLSLGWHTTIRPAYYDWIYPALLFISFSLIMYWLKYLHSSTLVWTLFAFHALLTIVCLLFIKTPYAFLKVGIASLENPEGYQKTLTGIADRTQMIPYAFWILIAAQILFILYTAIATERFILNSKTGYS